MSFAPRRAQVRSSHPGAAFVSGVPRLLAWLALSFGACTGEPSGVFAGFIDAPVAAVAAPVPGQVMDVRVREGQRVAKGELLVQLDPRERAAFLAQAQANVAHAQEQIREAERNARALRPTVNVAEADIARQQAELEDAQLELARAEQLVATGASTKSQLDAARARYGQALAAVSGTGATRQANAERVLAALASVRTARAALASSQAAAELARVQLAEAEIRSPFDAVVVEQNLQPGEWAASGTPVVTVEDLARKWVRVDVEETQLGHVRIGQSAEIRVVAFPERRFTGKVIEIGADAEFALNRDVKRGRPDVRTFRVRIELEDAPAELRPGMTADARLLELEKKL